MARKQKNIVDVHSTSREDDNYMESFKGTMEDMISMSEFLKEWEENSSWYTLQLAKLATAVESGGPLIVEDIKNRYSFIDGTTDDVISSTINNGLQMGTIPGSQIVVVSSEIEPYRTKAMCLSDTGMTSLIMRAGVDCSAISKASIVDKKTMIDIGLKVAGDKTALVLFSFGKARTFNGGGTYCVLKQSEMFDAIVNMLNTTYGDFSFRGGTFTHIRTQAEFELTGDTDNILETYKEACEDAGSTKDRGLKVMFEFSTSEIGEECATISVFLSRGGMRILIGSAIKVPHSGNSTTETFKEQLPLLLAKTKDLVSGLENLLSVKVNHPINCMISIAKYAGLAKTQTMTAAAELQRMMDEMKEADEKAEISAHDVFYSLQEALMEMRKANVSNTTILKCEENLSRTLVAEFPWDDYDVEVRPEWNASK